MIPINRIAIPLTNRFRGSNIPIRPDLIHPITNVKVNVENAENDENAENVEMFLEMIFFEIEIHSSWLLSWLSSPSYPAQPNV